MTPLSALASCKVNIIGTSTIMTTSSSSSSAAVFIIDLEGYSVELLSNQGFTVPKGVLHCTRAPERSVILMVETAAIVPTGDA